MRSSASRASAVLVGIAAIATLVVGCTTPPGPSETPDPTGATSSASSSPSPEPTPEPPPAFDPAGDAEANRPAVVAALEPLANAGGIPATRDVADALIAAGIPSSALQVTPDATAIGLAVDALLFSVLVNDTCVLGQFDGDGFTTTTAPVLSTGQCLIGATASLD